MDLQTAVVEMIAIDKEALLARMAELIEATRKAGMKVIYVVVGFRSGYPEVSPRNQSFDPIREKRSLSRGLIP